MFCLIAREDLAAPGVRMMRRVIIPLMLGAILLPVYVGAGGKPAGARVFVNQVGYLPAMPKMVVCDRAARSFAVYREGVGKAVFKGTLAPYDDPTSGRRVWRGDFSALATTGNYHIKIAGAGVSHPFRIGTDVYRDPLRLGLRFYYLQRCGAALQDPETGLTHGACHAADGALYYKDGNHDAGTRLDVAGGWHDAGDYGKYVSTTALTVAHLLSVYELWPEKFTDGQLGVPESGNGRPDILDEAEVGLDWLLAMQRLDGAVYHKVGGARWPSTIAPDLDAGTRNIYGVSTFATAKFAAAAAMAARVFAKADPSLAARCRDAARRAWAFLRTHGFYWQHTDFDDEGSGAYGQSTDAADRLWAALELTAIGEDAGDLGAMLNGYEPAAVGWQDAALLGLFDLARSSAGTTALRQAAGERVAALAERYVQAAKTSGYRCTLGYTEFAWASNKEILARGMAMILADRLQPDRPLRETALAQLDFVLGQNPLSKCFVTGIGADPPRMPHHRFEAA